MQDAAVGKLLGVHDVCLGTCDGADVYMSVLHLEGLICEQMGDLLFVPVYYNPDCTINVLSYSAVKDFAHKCYQWEDEDFFRVQLTKYGDTYVFR